MDTKYRTDDTEFMDDFSMDGKKLTAALDKIAQINQWLGGNKLTLKGVKTLIKDLPQSQEISIIDLGCGNGDMLRTLADYADTNNLKFRLIGVDANPFTIEYAKESSIQYPNISYLSADFFDKKFENFKYDIALCTLTLHHFKEEDVIRLLKIVKEQSRIGIVVNDLQRNVLAYRLFQVLCFIFRLNEVSKNDGLVSILRGFKKDELIAYSKKLQLNNYTIQWKWAFRYQWIITKI